MEKTKNIRKSILNRLTEIEDLQVEKHLVLSEEIIDTLCEITEKTGKEVAIYVDRKGIVISTEIGDENTVSLKMVTKRRGEESLSGIRCIHTHPNGDGHLSDVDFSALKKLKFDLIAAIGVKDGEMKNSQLAFLCPAEDGGTAFATAGPYTKSNLLKIDVLRTIEEVERNLTGARRVSKETDDEIEKAVLVGMEQEEDLDELEELLKTAGGVVLSRIVQSREKREVATLIGKGKVKELMLAVQAAGANLVVFDEELSGAQHRNLEEAVGVKIIDRTQLILDIFAGRAKSSEGKLQVELAQLKYSMPRLRGLASELSRSGGGIGTKGPGEKKLEIDKRRIRDKINDIEKEIKESGKHRQFLRENRKEGNTYQVCIVGYTNSGKSTLLNALSNSDIYAMDQLFATLDPTTRKVILPGGRDILVTDTVGFIKKLPHDLIDAFKSTLEEVVFADLLLHVIDVSNPEYKAQIKVVNEVLQEIGAGGKTVLNVYNKVDKLIDGYSELVTSEEESVFISAKSSFGLDKLLISIEAEVSKATKVLKLLIPYTDGKMLSHLHDNALRIINETHESEGTLIEAELDNILAGRLAAYIIE